MTVCQARPEDGGGLVLWRGNTTTTPLVGYPGRLHAHLFLNVINGRQCRADFAVYAQVRKAVIDLLHEHGTMAVPKLLKALRTAGDKHVVEATLRMLVSMGTCRAVKRKNGSIALQLEDSASEALRRRDYLLSLAQDLLASSQRIGHLVGHEPTVGSYREELLRGLLRRLLPERYRVSTGFIERCPRQLDILVFDAIDFAPLFREQEVVVVPREAVRAVIEVKTTLESGSVDESLGLLHEVFSWPHCPPVFQGVFAFASNFKTLSGPAESVVRFYKTHELRHHQHLVTAVCVPNQVLLLGGYDLPEDPRMHPYPVVSPFTTDEKGDAQTAVFLSLLLRHLDLPIQAKRVNALTFEAAERLVTPDERLPVNTTAWKPSMALPNSDHLSPDGAMRWLGRVGRFLEGRLPASELCP
ncbi:MAG TPA: DUF6602 domain-containing protein [Candidatus Acidoferrales bacterium]|jgi:hypothetical protein|nr:DUF6602 domain-containing protein [Candidatus Acidoferrales bacterium]